MRLTRTLVLAVSLALCLCSFAAPALAGDLSLIQGTTWRLTWTHNAQSYTDVIYLADEITDYSPLQLFTVSSLEMKNRYCYPGRCISGDVSDAVIQALFDGESVDMTELDFEYLATVIDPDTTDAYYYAFDVSGDSLTGKYTEDGWDDVVDMTGVKIESDGAPCDYPTPVGDFIYYVPYSPKAADFVVGFGVSNANNPTPTDIYVEYFSNEGYKLYQDTLIDDSALLPRAHYSFMRGQNLTEDGWIKITAENPIYGMTLAFGVNPDPLFDMDFKQYPATDLMAAHVDSSGGWISKAMMANPNDVEANVTLTFYTNDGVMQNAFLVIPKNGAVQYDLADEFPDMAGSLAVTSDVGVVGFVLYDGRGFNDANYVGGLSMTEAVDY